MLYVMASFADQHDVDQFRDGQAIVVFPNFVTFKLLRAVANCAALGFDAAAKFVPNALPKCIAKIDAMERSLNKLQLQFQQSPLLSFARHSKPISR